MSFGPGRPLKSNHEASGFKADWLGPAGSDVMVDGELEGMVEESWSSCGTSDTGLLSGLTACESTPDSLVRDGK